MRNYIIRWFIRRAAINPNELCKQIDARFKATLSDQYLELYLQSVRYSKAQARQDLIALFLNKFQRGGNYIEIGATDGVVLSNTHLLSRNFGWTGILVEPNLHYFKKLKKNRKTDKLFNCAISNSSGIEVDFFETKYPELSTLSIDYDDAWLNERNIGLKKTKVKTLTLADLINNSGQESPINFLSIDVEGAELEVLSSLNDTKVPILYICVEHSNNESRRTAIADIMSANGYSKLEFGFDYWDDWYELSSTQTS